jgi:NTP pyrophosphatase (non-canonical NTP hydrolase)
MSISDFQEMMKHIYFHRDSERGITGTYNWLKDEVEELGAALNEKNRKGIMDEFADVLAWLASLANVTDIGLETAATLKYNNACPKCQRSPCQCPLLG